MALDDDIRLLSSVDLFREIPEDQLRLLAFGTEHRLIPGGHPLFAEGDEADGGYVVADGQIDIVAIRQGREIVLESCQAGSLIGEMSLFTPNRRVAAAMARHNSEVLFVPRPLFRRMLEAYPDTAIALHDRIGRSVRRMIGQISQVKQRLDSIPDLPNAGPTDKKSQE